MSQKYFKYSLYSPMLENVGLNVYNSGHQRCSGGHFWGPAVRNFYLVHLVVSGKGILSVNGVQSVIEKGSLFFVIDGDEFSISSLDSLEYLYICFHGRRADELMFRFNINEGNNLFFGYKYKISDHIDMQRDS